MSAMGRVSITIPLVTWRDGRPRFFPGEATRTLGYKGEDLRHPDGRWLTLEECIAWSQARQAEIAGRRRAIAAGETTLRSTRKAVRSAGVVTVAEVVDAFLDSPRMQGKAIVEGRKKRAPLAANTVRFYRGVARLLKGFDDGAVWVSPADELTPRALAGILDRVEVLHGLAQARGLRAFVSVAWRHGRVRRLTGVDPVGGLEEPLPSLEPRVRPAGVAEALHLVAVADALGLPDAGDVICAGPWTGQRQNDRLSLPAAALTADGIYVMPSKKKARGERLLIPLAHMLAGRLETARARRAGWKVKPLTLFVCEATGRAWKEDWYRKVFRVIRHAAATGDAERDGDGQITKDASAVLRGVDVAAALAAAGLRAMPSLADLRDQDLRDTTMSWLALAGCDRFEIAAFSGHAFGQSDKVLRHYVAVPPEFGRRAMAKLEAWFDVQLGALKIRAES